ncbi:hypothetical protein AQUCO_01000034v1 [Aquilegia coerulea]|uniref:Phosphoglycerate mutase-like protein n=1 Tax=Aquilegia coerulea TaxID=218851 RepID=A0A2G5E7X8_AQUCA|nr:hypothetical protein AQUCO_01000034v1 [Aquilegia coerulea]
MMMTSGCGTNIFNKSIHHHHHLESSSSTSSSILINHSYSNSHSFKSYLNFNFNNNQPYKFLSFRPLSLPLSSRSSLSEMDGTVDPTLFPSHRCKTLHLIRHAQGIHNVEAEKDHKAFLSPALFDAHLTPLGWQQVDNLRTHVRECGLSKRIDLVITSPLLRTMQTAVGVFGGDSYEDGTDLPLMVANAGKSDRSAYSSLGCPPFIAVELCREHLGVRPCDKRRSITEYLPLFPAIDFSLVESDEDIWWKPDIREPNEGVAARGMKFLNWLWTRKEKEIAIVTHSGFLFHTLKELGNRYHPLMREEICKHFTNCELRSMVIVDTNMIGSDSSTTNYPGKIPQGPDLPSDKVALDNLK